MANIKVSELHPTVHNLLQAPKSFMNELVTQEIATIKGGGGYGRYSGRYDERYDPRYDQRYDERYDPRYSHDDRYASARPYYRSY